MPKKFWIMVTLLVVIPGFMLTVACQKRAVTVVKEPEKVEQPMPKAEEKKPAVAPEEKKEMGLDMMVMNEDIYFDFDKSNLKPDSQENLLRKAEQLRAHPEVVVTIEGNCDERGTPEYNLALGDRRAESAKAFLVNLGIDAARITTISYGEERPVCTQATEECWAKNRHDHFSVH
jgi:peptidoglycan-associated lipoprotein